VTQVDADELGRVTVGRDGLDRETDVGAVQDEGEDRRHQDGRAEGGERHIRDDHAAELEPLA